MKMESVEIMVWLSFGYVFFVVFFIIYVFVGIFYFFVMV